VEAVNLRDVSTRLRADAVVFLDDRLEAPAGKQIEHLRNDGAARVRDRWAMRPALTEQLRNCRCFGLYVPAVDRNRSKNEAKSDVPCNLFYAPSICSGPDVTFVTKCYAFRILDKFHAFLFRNPLLWLA
jgi:hypothetical protein